MRSRPGFSLVELLTALCLAGIIAVILGGALVAQLRLARHVSARAASADALRTAHAVLRSEVGRAAATDLRAIAADSIALRSFRGAGDLCAAGPDRLLLRYRGDRLPHPGKDSLLVLDGSGLERVLPVSDVRSATLPCPLPPGESGLQVGTSGSDLPRAGLALVFESGSYYISSRAVRYRLGAEGRQPLTAELFVHAGSGFSSSAAGVHLRLQTTRGDSLSAAAPFLLPGQP